MNHTLNLSRRTLSRRTASAFRLSAMTVLSAVALSACYVVPIHQAPYSASHAANATSGVAPAQLVLNARLYPANDIAAPYGVLSGSITNHLNGRGEITVQQADEVFRGEATRDANHSRNGSANGAGNKGGYMHCSYTMNSQTQGTGSCKFNNGAVYRFHVGA